MSEEVTSQPEENKPSLSLLAKEAFGSNYYGEVQEKAPEPTPEPSAEPEQEAQAQLELQEAPPQETEEPDQEDVQAAQPEQQQEEAPISSLQELIDHASYDPEWFNSLQVDVKVDGESSKAKLSDIVKSYQLTSAAEKRLNDAKEKAKTQYQALADKQQELDATVSIAAAVLERQKERIIEEEKTIDWSSLRTQDPAEWSAKQQEFANRKAAVDRETLSLHQALQQKQQQDLQEAEQTRAAQLQAEAQSLLEKLPEWSDQEVAEREKGEVSDYLVSLSFTPEEVARASDHRLVIMARKAMLYDKMQSKAEPAKKKLVTIPKTLKPGVSKPVDPNQAKLTEAKKILSKNPNGRNAEDAALAILKLRRGK